MPIVEPRQKKQPEARPEPPAPAPAPPPPQDQQSVKEAVQKLALFGASMAAQNTKLIEALKEEFSKTHNKNIRATVERDEHGLITAINMNVTHP